jgi:hypothetical protein
MNTLTDDRHTTVTVADLKTGKPQALHFKEYEAADWGQIYRIDDAGKEIAFRLAYEWRNHRQGVEIKWVGGKSWQVTIFNDFAVRAGIGTGSRL